MEIQILCITQINDSNKLYDILRYLYYLYGVLKRHRIFYKNEKNNLSTSQRLFCNFQKTFENFRKSYVMYSNYKIKK
jgi:hypothetical protein